MQTIRQAFILLRQNPLLSTIFILGTAFAITMIMAIVITWQMKYADIEPEVNRNRSLYISKMHLQGKENKNWNNYTACSPAFMKNCVQPLPEVEACTAFVPATVALVSMPDGTNAVKVDAMETDPGFWKVFRMQFVAGRGFDDSDRGGDVSAIVVAASVARKLFGTTDAVGKTVLLNRNEARICGVVKDVSVIAKDAYAQVWRMYPAKLQDATSIWSYAQSHTVVALARSSEDIPAIRQGIAKRVKDINAVQTEVLMDIMEQPDEIVTHVNHVWANVGPDLRMLYIQYALAFGCECGAPSADYHLRHSADSACHQSFEHDTEPLASAGIGNRSAPCFRQYTDGADWADCGGESGNDFIGRCCRFAVERGLCIRGQHVAFCAGIQSDFEPAGSGCFHSASCFHLWVGVAVLLCVESDEQWFPGMEGFPHRDSERIGRTVALNACR